MTDLAAIKERADGVLLTHVPVGTRSAVGEYDPGDLQCASDLDDWPCEQSQIANDVLALLADTPSVEPAGLDGARLAEAMNDFERASDLSVVVHTNLGTHHPDCAHVGWIVAAYARLLPTQASDSPEKP